MDNSNLNKEIQDNENVVDNNVNSNVNPMINNSLNDNVNNTLNANTEVASSIESNEVKAPTSEITPLKEVEEVKVNQENQNVNKDIEPENNEKVNQTSGKKINGFEISLIIIIILLIVVIGIILYKTYFTDKEEDNKNDTNDNENGEVAKPNEEEYTLNVYKSDNNSKYLCQEQSEYCSELAYAIKTETKNAEMIVSDDEDLFILYKDNGLKIYDVKTAQSEKIDIPDNYDNYIIYASSDKSKIIGITYKNRDDKYMNYYNTSTSKSLEENTYISIVQVGDNYLSVLKEGHKYSLLNIESGEEELSTIYDDSIFGMYYSVKTYNGKNLYLEVEGGNANDFINKIYSSSKKEIASEIVDFNCSVYNGNLYFYSTKDSAIKKYDFDGNLLTTLNIKKDDYQALINNYVAYLKNGNNLTLMNIDTKEEKNIDKIKDGDYVDNYTTGYYSRDKLDSMNEKDKAAGIYVVIYYKEKDASDNYGMEYCYTDNGEIKTYPIKNPMDGRAKPVLYLYPTEKTNIKVEFEHPEYLTTTYPKYTNSWNVTAYPNGDLYDENNKYYYALYWDETRYHEVDFKEGFYVTKENAISFLEEKLDIIGLNKKEKNEFIMYWLPILERNEKNLVYFELTEEREATNKLIITPKPDALLRVSIHIKKVDKEIEIKEQHLEKFKREGFVAVEWGGMTY